MSAAFPACCCPLCVSTSSRLDDPRTSSEFYPAAREMSYRVIRRKQRREIATNNEVALVSRCDCGRSCYDLIFLLEAKPFSLVRVTLSSLKKLFQNGSRY